MADPSPARLWTAAEFDRLRAIEVEALKLAGLLGAMRKMSLAKDEDGWEEAMIAFWDKEPDICAAIERLAAQAAIAEAVSPNPIRLEIAQPDWLEPLLLRLLDHEQVTNTTAVTPPAARPYWKQPRGLSDERLALVRKLRGEGGLDWPDILPEVNALPGGLIKTVGTLQYYAYQSGVRLSPEELSARTKAASMLVPRMKPYMTEERLALARTLYTTEGRRLEDVWHAVNALPGERIATLGAMMAQIKKYGIRRAPTEAPLSAREALIIDLWPEGDVSTDDIVARVNAIPGPTVSDAQVAGMAMRLQLSRGHVAPASRAPSARVDAPPPEAQAPPPPAPARAPSPARSAPAAPSLPAQPRPPAAPERPAPAVSVPAGSATPSIVVAKINTAPAAAPATPAASARPAGIAQPKPAPAAPVSRPAPAAPSAAPPRPQARAPAIKARHRTDDILPDVGRDNLVHATTLQVQDWAIVHNVAFDGADLRFVNRRRQNQGLPDIIIDADPED
jgi:hypothetical protein